MTDFIYDIETLPNVWTCSAKNMKTGRRFRFEISKRRNDRDAFDKWIYALRNGGHRMVGFNNIHYDYPMVHYLLMECDHIKGWKQLTKELKGKNDAIFRDAQNPHTKFNHNVWASEHIVQQIDLFKIHHFDNKARSISLKRLQFNMRLRSIVEFDMDFNAKLPKKQIPHLLDYNDWDVDSTGDLYLHSASQIAFREDMTERFEQDFMNDNDTKIGEKYLTGELISKVGRHVIKDENNKKRGTHRDMMLVEDFMFDYVKFKTPELQAVYDKLMGLKVFLVNGKFHWNEHEEYPAMIAKVEEAKKVYLAAKRELKRVTDEQKKFAKIEPSNDETRLKTVQSAEYYFEGVEKVYNKLSTKYADHHISATMPCGFVFEFGKGGLHGTLRNTVKVTTDDMVVVDLDVTSYYPHIGIKNKLYPFHLTEEFCYVYENVAVMRRDHAKGTTENAMLKLALNGAYGKTNSAYSVFYDPLYMITVTVNGQLMLTMLWEWLSEIEGVELIQANTDGITIHMPRNKKARKAVSKVCRKWQKLTKLQLEQAIYSRMWVRDGNNYMAEYQGSGAIKAKGDYMYRDLYHTKGIDASKIDQWHKNHSALVVQKAVEAELVTGVRAEDFIRNHDDIYDFFLNTNANRQTQLVAHDPLYKIDHEIQRVSRYIVVSKGGRYLFKKMKPTATQRAEGKTDMRRIAVNKGQQVKVYNEIESEDVADYDDIDYKFYINEANKLLKPFGKIT